MSTENKQLSLFDDDAGLRQLYRIGTAYLEALQAQGGDIGPRLEIEARLARARIDARCAAKGITPAEDFRELLEILGNSHKA